MRLLSYSAHLRTNFWFLFVYEEIIQMVQPFIQGVIGLEMTILGFIAFGRDEILAIIQNKYDSYKISYI